MILNKIIILIFTAKYNCAFKKKQTTIITKKKTKNITSVIFHGKNI